MTDIYVAHHEGLVGVHRALLDAFSPLVGAEDQPVERLLQPARAAVAFLVAHHEMESSALFPGLRKYGRLRTTDVAFLDARDSDHVALHRRCEEMLATIGALHPHAATLVAQARDIVAMLAPHTREEEEGLSPARLREMIDVDGFTALGRELEARRAEVMARLAR